MVPLAIAGLAYTFISLRPIGVAVGTVAAGQFFKFRLLDRPCATPDDLARDGGVAGRSA